MYYLYLEKYEPAAYCALTGETVARAIRRRLERGRTAAADSLSASSSSEDDSRAHEDQDVQPDVGMALQNEIKSAAHKFFPAQEGRKLPQITRRCCEPGLSDAGV